MGTTNPLSAYPSSLIILFDGVCTLCSGSVQFIIKRDKTRKFKFASLQSFFAREQLLKFNLDHTTFRSIVLLQDGKALEGSEAILEIVRHLSGAWPLLYAFKIVPKFIREGVYKLIANNRYQLFGKRESCMIPTPELRDRFVED
jgi:predicted DCC family thiol-disulfide oxidoreductase YuxK